LYSSTLPKVQSASYDSIRTGPVLLHLSIYRSSWWRHHFFFRNFVIHVIPLSQFIQSDRSPTCKTESPYTVELVSLWLSSRFHSSSHKPLSRALRKVPSIARPHTQHATFPLPPVQSTRKCLTVNIAYYTSYLCRVLRIQYFQYSLDRDWYEAWSIAPAVQQQTV